MLLVALDHAFSDRLELAPFLIVGVGQPAQRALDPQDRMGLEELRACLAHELLMGLVSPFHVEPPHPAHAQGQHHEHQGHLVRGLAPHEFPVELLEDLDVVVERLELGAQLRVPKAAQLALEQLGRVQQELELVGVLVRVHGRVLVIGSG